MNEKSGWSPEPGDTEERRGREPLPSLIRRLITDARAYALAETARQKARGRFIAANVRTIAFAAIVALFLLFGLLVAGLMGLMWVLEPFLGRGFAVLAALGGGLAAILVCVLIILSRLGRLKGLKGKKP